MSKGSAAVHGGLFLAALAIVALSMPACLWPWYMLGPLLIYACIVFILPPLRQTAPRLSLGKMRAAPLLSALVLSAATVAVLIGFQVWARPDVTALAGNLPISAFGNLFLAWVCISMPRWRN